jgi:hypothetical protein
MNSNNEKYNVKYQNVYNYKDYSKYIVILFAFIFIIYLITIYFQYN